MVFACFLDDHDSSQGALHSFSIGFIRFSLSPCFCARAARAHIEQHNHPSVEQLVFHWFYKVSPADPCMPRRGKQRPGSLSGVLWLGESFILLRFLQAAASIRWSEVEQPLHLSQPADRAKSQSKYPPFP